MVLQKFLDRFNQKKIKIQEAEDELRINRLVTQKQKTGNERELERFMEEDRQKFILKRLQSYRKQKRDDFLKGNQILQTKNVMNGKATLLHEDKKILAGKNMFMMRGNLA